MSKYKVINSRMQQLCYTAAVWLEKNPVLLAGEIGLESDTGILKVGDGTTAWSNLPGIYGAITASTSEPDVKTAYWIELEE